MAFRVFKAPSLRELSAELTEGVVAPSLRDIFVGTGVLDRPQKTHNLVRKGGRWHPQGDGRSCELNTNGWIGFTGRRGRRPLRVGFKFVCDCSPHPPQGGPPSPLEKAMSVDFAFHPPLEQGRINTPSPASVGSSPSGKKPDENATHKPPSSRDIFVGTGVLDRPQRAHNLVREGQREHYD